jgi:outer membrane protein OmpA-like peptidoglycan-associated protein
MQFKTSIVIIALLTLSNISWANSRKVCDVEHGRNLYLQENVIRVTNYGLLDNEKNCESKSSQKVTKINDIAPTPKTIIIPELKVQFLPSSAKLTDTYVKELSSLVKVLKAENKEIEITGHTDASGNPLVNQSLSLKRAEAVKAYLVENGIESSRISTLGYGSSEPIADNQTQAGRAQNRRIDVKVK